MSITHLKYAILKAINLKDSGERQFRRSADYVINPQKTEDGKWVIGNFLNPNDAVKGLKLIEEHHNNSDLSGRLFKHLVFSFGSPDLSTVKAKEIMEAVMEYYKEYPYIGALHTDVPKRLHAHFILGMRNLSTGKKFSQSKSDLMDFRGHFHKIAVEAGLLGLKDFMNEKQVNHAEAAMDTDYNSLSYVHESVYPAFPAIGPTIQAPMAEPNAQRKAGTMSYPQQDMSIVQSMFELVRNDLHDFFELGYIGGIYDGK